MEVRTLKSLLLSSVAQRASFTASLTRSYGHMVRCLEALPLGVISTFGRRHRHAGSESNGAVRSAARTLEVTHRSAKRSHPDPDPRYPPRLHISYCLMGGTHLYPALF